MAPSMSFNGHLHPHINSALLIYGWQPWMKQSFIILTMDVTFIHNTFFSSLGGLFSWMKISSVLYFAHMQVSS